jgi:hypothetical protein
MSILDKKLGRPQKHSTTTDKMISMVSQTLGATNLTNPSIGHSVISMEGLSDTQRSSLDSAESTLRASLESIVAELNLHSSVYETQIEAGVIAGLLSGSPRELFSMKTSLEGMASTADMHIITRDFGGDATDSRAVAFEAYDDRENRNAAEYSITYNMQASRQDEFGETFFPTIVVSPDNVGFDAIARIMSVFNDSTRNINGALTNFQKTNIIRAVANPYVIQNDATNVVPYLRTQSAANFVASTIVAPSSVVIEGEVIPTAPLLVGASFDLLAISQSDTMLAAGVNDITDAIDPDVNLTNLYVTVTGSVGGVATTDVLKLAVGNLPLSNFTYSTQNNYRLQSLNFSTTSVVLNAATLQVNGAPLAVMSGIATGNYQVRLNVAASGSCNIELGDTVVYGNNVSIASIHDSNGNTIDPTTGAGLAIVTAFSTAKIVGYDLQAFRTNMNRRQRGQLVDVTYYTQRYNIPLRSPVTAIRPVNSVDQSDAPYIQTLISTTRIRLMNQAVTQLIASYQFLSNYIDTRLNNSTDAEGDNDPDLLGIGRFYVRPSVSGEVIDMAYAVDSLTATERASDIQNTLVNKIRDHAFRMYRDSEYMAASDALSGGKAPMPTVIIGTDPVIAGYLNVAGDLRTLGAEFNFRIVSSLDQRVQNKIFITFGIFDESRNTAPNPLNFGNMAWSPELVMNVQITRNGAISKETVVQPRFKFITNLPIMGMLQVVNLPQVLNKMPIQFANVTPAPSQSNPNLVDVNYF